MSNKTVTAVMLAVALALGLPQAARAETVQRIGMTVADIPRTLGQPDQGFEGDRFTGRTMYDSLTMWDLSSADKASVVIPGLSTEWKRGQRLETIPGTPPSLDEAPTNCSFVPRCSFAQSRCVEQLPPNVRIAQDRTARCILAEPAPDAAVI